eukprot:CAMPEP_0116063064 /NCGR_PEP_ID=MMETSP0322-20121206/8173_1 /TAXON_ID=163516 /ORGANISM="Leptocylindrus danicus var. apora, Strain B651" /LENGTH=222 /DNA_ID=CAMNT_0003548573 /DNA_START=240 /DNA_END=908 /DNA_ORIENTATION=-
MASLVDGRLIPPYFSRKIVHISAGCWILFWGLFDEDHPSWMLNVTVPFLMSIQLFYKGAVKNDRRDPDVVSMSRSGDPAELLQGPLQFTIVMTYVGLKYFMTEEAIYIMAALGIGDGLAAIVGPIFGTRFYTNKFGATKSAEGVGACILGTYAGAYLFANATGACTFNDQRARVVATIAGVVESQSPSDYDNFSVPGAVLLFFMYRTAQDYVDEEDDEDFGL